MEDARRMIIAALYHLLGGAAKSRVIVIFIQVVMGFRWALVDCETTGLRVCHDEVIEIAVRIITECGEILRWQSLIKPKSSIPEVIVLLTGISNASVQSVPRFSDIAKELYDLLVGAVLVAHNARFDYGFLKNEPVNNFV